MGSALVNDASTSMVTGPGPAFTSCWSGTSCVLAAGGSGYWALVTSVSPTCVGMSYAWRMRSSDGWLLPPVPAVPMPCSDTCCVGLTGSLVGTSRSAASSPTAVAA